LRVFGKNHEDD